MEIEVYCENCGEKLEIVQEAENRSRTLRVITVKPDKCCYFLTQSEIKKIAEALAHALFTTQLKLLQKRLIESEFWHSLNRKRLINNKEVDRIVTEAYEQLQKQAKKRTGVTHKR